MTDPAIKVIAMPSDTNPDGDMFGGWIISQMDLSGYLTARKIARKKLATVAIDNIVFHAPVFVGDCLECYTHVEKIGRTSITVTVARGTNQYGTNLAVQVTNNSALASNTSTVQITPQSGWAFTNLGTPNATSTNRITAVADLVSGDQLAYDTKSGMVIVYSDATFSADSSVANFSVEAWSSGNGWGSAATQTLSAGAVVTARIVGILSLF